MGPFTGTEPQLNTTRMASAWAVFEFIPISAIRVKITGWGQGRPADGALQALLLPFLWRPKRAGFGEPGSSWAWGEQAELRSL